MQRVAAYVVGVCEPSAAPGGLGRPSDLQPRILSISLLARSNSDRCCGEAPSKRAGRRRGEPSEEGGTCSRVGVSTALRRRLRCGPLTSSTQYADGRLSTDMVRKYTHMNLEHLQDLVDAYNVPQTSLPQ